MRRSVLIGLSLSALLAFLDSCDLALVGRSSLTEDGYGAGALFFLFLLICAGPFLRRLRILRSDFRRDELLIIFSMLLMVSAVSGRGFVYHLLPHMAGFTQYATPENRWDSAVIPLLPDGLVIKDPGVAKGFFEGVGPEGKIPFEAWAGPLGAWGVLLAGFSFTMISVMVILRKRWVEEERLSFPLAEITLALVGNEKDERPFKRNPVFWTGFSVSSSVGLSHILSRFSPIIRPLNLFFYTRFYRNSIGLPFYTHFIVLGISYLVSLEVLGSILLFTFLTYFQMYLIVSSVAPIVYNPPSWGAFGRLNQEVMGGLLAVVGWGLYEARHHVRDVLRKAFGSADEIDDSDEFLSYRTAVFGSIAGTVFTGCWLWLTGLSVWTVPLFLGIMITTFLGVTRVLAEAGLVIRAPLSQVQMLINWTGTQTLGAPTMAGFFLSQPWSHPNKPHIMGSSSTMMKFRLPSEVSGRSLLYPSTLALFVGGTVAAVTFLYFAYSLGGNGFAATHFTIHKLHFHLKYFGGSIMGPSEGDPFQTVWAGIGALVVGGLIFARRRFFWWPIHPIGFVATSFSQAWWLNIFIAWLIKRNVLKYGGPSLYGRTKPFFIGLIMGEAVVRSVGSIVIMLTGRT